MSRLSAASNTTRLVLAGVGLLQGFVYFLAHEFWPDTQVARALTIALLFVVSVGTVTVHLAWTGSDVRRLAGITAALSGLFGLLALWVGLQIPAGQVPYRADDERLPFLIAGTAFAIYAVWPFLQVYQRSGRREYPYADLFHHAWNNFFILAIGAFLTGAFWLIILLWFELFKLIDITFFEDVFTSAPFVAMSLTTVFGYGVALGRERERITNTLRGITLAVFKTLMPLLALIAILFLVSLPFTGLQPLWDTGHASAVLLALMGLMVLFLNGVYQDGTGDPPYDPRVRFGIRAALVGLPVYAGITYFALGLRIGQYGLTPARFFGTVVTVVAALYVIGYAAAAVRRGPWMQPIQRVNLAMAWVIVVLVVLVHTPLGDPVRWSARNQFSRLADGDVTAQEFDYGFLRYRLGHVGWRTLAALDSLTEHPEAATIRERVAATRAAKSYPELLRQPTVLLAAEDIGLIGPTLPPPADFWEFVSGNLTRDQTNACRENDDCLLFAAALDRDSDAEYVLILSGEGYEMYAYDRDSTGAWGRVGRLGHVGAVRDRPDRTALLDSLRVLGAEPVDVPYRDLLIGEIRWRLLP